MGKRILIIGDDIDLTTNPDPFSNDVIIRVECTGRNPYHVADLVESCTWDEVHFDCRAPITLVTIDKLERLAMDAPFNMRESISRAFFWHGGTLLRSRMKDHGIPSYCA